MKRPQRDRVLEVLDDGRWHSTRELQEAGGGLRVPARVELRKRGHRIEVRRSTTTDGATVYLYCLTKAAPASRSVAAVARPRPIDDCLGCGRRCELVDADLCAECAGRVAALELAPAEPAGQLVFDAMRQEAA